MIKNIVFDMGNVLLRYDPILPCRRHAGDEETARALCNAIFGAPEWGSRMDAGTIDDAGYLALVQSRMDSPRLKELTAQVIADWTLDALYPVTGMDALTLALKERGYKLYVLSNMCPRFREIEYKIPNYSLFEGAIVSAEERLLKPDARIFMRLCEKYALKPDECLFIDDLQRNVDGAEAVGMTGYCIADGNVARLSEYLLSLEG